MSDSFADLWNSSVPSQPQKSVPLSQQKPTTSTSYNQPRPKQDVFALLSQSSTPAGRSTSSFNNSSLNLGASRPGSSLNTASPGGSRPLTPSLSNGSTSRPGSSLSSGASKPASSGNNAFNDLLSGSFGSVSKSSTNMTIAERAAMAEKQRLASQTQSRGQAAASDNLQQWAGLDALGGGTLSATTSMSSSKVVVDDQDDWGLGDFAAAPTGTSTATKPPASQRGAPSSDSLLDFGDFDSSTTTKTSAAPPSVSQSQSKSGSLWDMDDFTSGSTSAYQTASTPQAKPFDSPDFDFDFGNREDQPSNGHSHHEEDDILGMLSKPVEAVRAQSTPSQPSPPAPALPPRRSQPRSSSPPPHILGQVVEMGFSVQQAKSALAQTESGIDVQAALEILLGEGGDNASAPPPGAQNRSPSPPPRRRFVYEDDDDPEFAAMQRRRRQQRQASGTSNAEGSSTPSVQEQADKIIAQASEIGLSVLSKASLFWKEGKEKVQKVYEERAGVGQDSTDRGFPPTRTGTRDTRPKWMQDIAAHSEEDPTSPRRGGFRDDRDGGEASGFRDDDAPPSRQRGAPAGSSQPAPPQRHAPQPEPEVDLFNSSPPAPSEPSEPKAYVSPWRWKKPTADAAPTPPPQASNGPSRAAPPRARSPPKPKRNLLSCPEMTLDIVRQHKTKGTEAFKLGQFSVAEEEYSKAIMMLPAKHLLLVPLHTNRALARIRCGECKGAVEDAAEALAIVGRGADSWKGWHPSNEDGGWELAGGSGEANGGYGVPRDKGSEWADAWGRGVDLKDGWIKAVRRRAEAFEGMEKWSEARMDWEVLTGAGWVDGKTREDAVRGIGRCKKMLAGEGASGGRSEASVAPKVKPRPRPAPAKINAVPSGSAVKAYREQVNAAEAEDTLKHQLKDSVEAKLLAWKKGKETNLRALLASLDTVLWEEVIKDMGGKPGLADLVSGGGVKKWYMKSVARVHPDKLNANNSTVEQRMIAGGVFGALNEAWIAFKQ